MNHNSDNFKIIKKKICKEKFETIVLIVYM